VNEVAGRNPKKWQKIPPRQRCVPAGVTNGALALQNGRIGSETPVPRTVRQVGRHPERSGALQNRTQVQNSSRPAPKRVTREIGRTAPGRPR